MRLTTEQLAELRAMEKGATAGPLDYDADDYTIYGNPDEYDMTFMFEPCSQPFQGYGNEEADAQLIAKVRNLLPALLDDYEEMQKKLVGYRDFVNEFNAILIRWIKDGDVTPDDMNELLKYTWLDEEGEV